MAAIIRKDSPRSVPSRTAQPVAFSFSDLRTQADEYLDTVRREAAKIIQHAHQHAEQIRRQAEIDGRTAAECAAESVLDEKVGKRMDTLLPTLEQLVQQLNDARGELQTHWERSVLKFATTIAERIIRRELSREPQITLDLLAEALRLAAGSPKITLRMSPDDRANLGTQVERLTAAICRLGPCDIVADPSITPGGCRIVTRFGEIDHRIESQLRRIEEELA
jgi:flagellar assembly protein FliH